MLAGSVSEQAPKRTATVKRSGRDAFRKEAFAHALRHSRRVRALKIIVPVAAMLMAGAFAAASYALTPGKVNVAKTDDSVYANGKLVMANPKLEGVTTDNRPYSMNAVRAIQDPKSQDIIELEQISAKLPINVQDWVSVDAKTGIYDRLANTLKVTSPLTVKTTEGMTAQLTSAFVDISKGNLETADPVEIVLNGTRVQADSMKVFEKGKVLVFENRVRMHINADQLQKIRSSNGG
ncbi:MAG: LPS export ABC transporter periplasmic protein LptC [Rhizobiaceae bacterium]